MMVIEDILKEITYKDWEFHLGAGWLQVRFPAPDLVTGNIELQYGRKWKLSQYMTKSEIVQTAFKAVLSAEEHECRETFRYRNQAIFGPHFSVDALAYLARFTKNLDTRHEMEVA